MNAPTLPPLLQRFFTDRLLGQLGASPHTVASYRDTFRLLLLYGTQQFKRAPCTLQVEDLDVRFLSRFLDHLEHDRGNTARTRNTRLSALHAFFQYVALNEPALALHCQRILAMPAKRREHRPVEFLTEDEMAALISAPDVRTWIGRRDRAILLFALQTGLRNSEIRSLRNQDLELRTGAHVRCIGKGRNYDDLAIMRSSTPRTPVCRAAIGHALRSWRRLCA